MPSREVSEKDVLDAFRLLALLSAKLTDSKKVETDATTKRRTAESGYQASVRKADSVRDEEINVAQTKRDRAIQVQNDRVSKANDEIVTAQKVLDDFQDKLESDAGVRITLPGAVSAGGTVRV